MSYTDKELAEVYSDIFGNWRKHEKRKPAILYSGQEGVKRWENIWMHEWFKHLWDVEAATNGVVKCYECGGNIPRSHRELTTCYSHILEKAKYPQYAGNPENVVIVHPACHNLYTMKPKEAKNQYNRYLQLKQKYGLS